MRPAARRGLLLTRLLHHSVFSAFPGKQQQLLELTSTRERLKAVQEVLRETSRYLGATSALKSALQEIGNKPSEDTPQ